MDIDQEINLMLQSVVARTGEQAREIVCHRDALELMRSQSTRFYTSEADSTESGCVGRYMGIPVQVCDSIEPGRAYVIPEFGGSPYETTYSQPYWTSTPYLHYSPMHGQCIAQEEEKEIDEESFMGILNRQSP